MALGLTSGAKRLVGLLEGTEKTARVRAENAEHQNTKPDRPQTRPPMVKNPWEPLLDPPR